MAGTPITPYVDLLTPEAVLTAIEERNPDTSLAKNFLYPSVMPVRNVPEDEFNWEITRSQGQLAGIYGQDGRPVPAEEIDSDMALASVARIMANRVLDETSVKNLVSARALYAGSPDAINNPIVAGPLQRHQEKVAKAILDCDDQIERMLEYFCTQALQGRVQWPPRDSSGNPLLPGGQHKPYWGRAMLDVTLPFPDNYKQDATTLTDSAGNPGPGYAWDDYAHADLVTDIGIISDIIADTSGLGTGRMTAIMSKKMLRHMAKNENLAKILRGDGTLPQPRNTILPSQLRQLVADVLDLDIVLYDQAWTYNSNTPMQRAIINRVRYIPDDVVIFYPTGVDLGFMASSPAKGPNATWQPGKFAWFYETKAPPFTTELGVGMNAWPVNQRWDTVFVYHPLA